MGKKEMPNHIAIIMDGNRRWAREKELDVKQGHKAGAKTLERIVRYANKIGLKYITVYAFSTENWKRSKEEVGALMLLIKKYLDEYSKRADTENIKIRFIGDISVLSQGVQSSMKKCEERTKDNTGIVFSIAINYGGREEIVNCMKNIANEVKQGNIDIENIDENLVSNILYTVGVPDPDIIVRTSGELRVSNFLLWQLAYSEFLFIEKNWPDFSEDDLDYVIKAYNKRNRKKGG